MRIIKLAVGDDIFTDHVSIREELHKNDIHWLDNAEIDNAVLEIKDGKLYWYGGLFYFGDWEYGIWMDGTFVHGNWHNGIFYQGVFKNGIWYDGIFIKGTIEGGEFLKGDFRDPVIKGGKFAKGLIEKEHDQKETVLSFGDYKKSF